MRSSPRFLLSQLPSGVSFCTHPCLSPCLLPTMFFPTSPSNHVVHHVPSQPTYPQSAFPRTRGSPIPARVSQDIFTAHSFFFFQRVQIPGHAPLGPCTLAEQEEPGYEAVPPARPYLHAANVDGEHGREEEHLQEEVGHQAHHGEEAELLQAAHTHRNQLRQLRDVGWISPLQEKGSSAPCCPGHGPECVLVKKLKRKAWC